jgi:hypothetical protein
VPRLQPLPRRAHDARRRRPFPAEHVEEIVLALALERRDAEDLAGAQRERDLLNETRGQGIDLERRLGLVEGPSRRLDLGGVALGGLGRRARGLRAEHVLDDPLLAALLRRNRGDRAAVAQDRRPITRRDHLLQPVGDEEHRPALLTRVAHDGEDALGEVRGERGRDLVEEQEPRPPGERPREVDHAEHRERKVAGELREVDVEVEAAELAPDRTGVGAGQAHVLRHRQVRHERRVLEHGREPDSRGLRRRMDAHGLSVHRDGARVAGDHAREQLHERRLARPVRAEERVHLARIDDEVGRAERGDRAVALRQAERFEEWRAFGHGKRWRRAQALLHQTCCRPKVTAPCS